MEDLGMLFEHYLAVMPWRTYHCTRCEGREDIGLDSISRTEVSFYYDESVLKFASAVGTKDIHRERSARICVEIDLSLPVVL